MHNCADGRKGCDACVARLCLWVLFCMLWQCGVLGLVAAVGCGPVPGGAKQQPLHVVCL